MAASRRGATRARARVRHEASARVDAAAAPTRKPGTHRKTTAKAQAKAPPPIEIVARGNLPLGMTPAKFLATYWQKHPLLVRRAFPDFVAPLTPNDLAGLACEPLATSRLITHEARRDRWTVRTGPFTERDFTRTPKTHWTLLVQDCDKLIADIDALLGTFAFIPRFRVDDVMTSYAAPGGSVGAHVDQYDVFLLQGVGSRRWQIDARADAPREFRDDVELKLLRRFDPTHDWVLEPGDMLYLPPGVPHHGVAIDDCLTFSIGMRAPSTAELLLDLAEAAAERLPETRRYADPDLAPASAPHEIPADAIARAATLARAALEEAAADPTDWFGRFITRYRSAHVTMPAGKRIDVAALERALKRGRVLHRSPWSRYAWVRHGRGARAFFAGDAWPVTLALARLIGANDRLDATACAGLSRADRDALFAMLNAGHWVLADDH